MTLERLQAPAIPTANPRTTGIMAPFMTIRLTDPPVAPNASRTPISLVLLATAYETTP